MDVCATIFLKWGLQRRQRGPLMKAANQIQICHRRRTADYTRGAVPAEPELAERVRFRLCRESCYKREFAEYGGGTFGLLRGNIVNRTKYC